MIWSTRARPRPTFAGVIWMVLPCTITVSGVSGPMPVASIKALSMIRAWLLPCFWRVLVIGGLWIQYRPSKDIVLSACAMTQVNLLADSAWGGCPGPLPPNNPAMTRPWLLWLVAAVAFLTGTAHAQVTYPPRPAEGEFLADAASLIQPQDKAKVRSTCEALLQSKGVPLLVVTINSMSDYGASGWPIERYAMNLFDEWGIGHSGNRNSGVLLLVSRNDRKVRIEMGAMWTHDRDALAASVINGTIVPRFKAGDFSGGIRDGVDALARQLGSPLGGAAPPSAGSNYGMPNSTTPTAPLHSTGMSRLLGPLACIIVPIVFIVIISIIPKIGRGLGGGSMGPGYGGGHG